MAYDKVVDSTFLDGGLTLIADAIREKNGSEDELLFPDDFVTAIAAIEGGGGSEEIRHYYYDNGQSSSEVGTWSGINIRSNDGWANGSFATTLTDMTITVNNSSYGFGATNKLDWTFISELRIVAAAPGFGGGDYDQAVVWISPVRSTATGTNYVIKQELKTGTNIIDVSSLSGSYYLVIDAASDYSRTLTVTEIYGVEDPNTVYLYSEGNEFSALTGGWTARGWVKMNDDAYVSRAPTLTKNSTYMTVSQSKGNCYTGVAEVVKDIDLTGISTIAVEFDGVAGGASGEVSEAWIVATPRTATYWYTSAKARSSLFSASASTIARKTVYLNTANAQGLYDIAIGAVNQTTAASLSVNIYSIKGI